LPSKSGAKRRQPAGGDPGPKVALRTTMTFAAVVDRVRAEFVEMPGMQLTLAQATRLWNLGPDDCRSVIDTLVDSGFLRWTAQRTVVRTGRDAGVAATPETNVLVRRQSRFDNSVASK
jgi:hypothetical protein